MLENGTRMVEYTGTYLFPKKHDIRLDKAETHRTLRNLLPLESLHHLSVAIRSLTLDTTLRCKASVGLDQLIPGNASSPLKGIDVLGKTREEKILLVNQSDKRVCEGWSKFAWSELLGKDVDCYDNAQEGTKEDGMEDPHGFGFSLKNSISNTASGEGRFRCSRLALKGLSAMCLKLFKAEAHV